MKIISKKAETYFKNENMYAGKRMCKLVKRTRKVEEAGYLIPNYELKKIKDCFLSIFRSQKVWKEIIDNERHFIYSPDRMEIFDINKVFLNKEDDFSVFLWLDHVKSILLDEQRCSMLEEGTRIDYRNGKRFEMKNAIYYLGESHFYSETDADQFERLKRGEVFYTPSSNDNEFGLVLGQIELHLNINPYRILEFDIEKKFKGKIVVEILEKEIDILDIYRFMRKHNDFAKALACTINVLYAITYTEYVTDSKLLVKGTINPKTTVK